MWKPLFGAIQKVRSSNEGGGGQAKSEHKRTGGGEGSTFLVRSFLRGG